MPSNGTLPAVVRKSCPTDLGLVAGRVRSPFRMRAIASATPASAVLSASDSRTPYPETLASTLTFTNSARTSRVRMTRTSRTRARAMPRSGRGGGEGGMNTPMLRQGWSRPRAREP